MNRISLASKRSYSNVTTLNLPNQIPIEEFLSNPEEEIIYEVPENDKIIEKLIEIYKK